MRKILTAGALLAALALMACNTIEGAGRDISACNTIEGAGRDISAAGHAISGTASDVAHH
jgi:predicted small secreted protein